MKLGELFYELGFKEDVTKLNDFIGMVGNLDMQSIFAAAGLGALYTATKKLMTISSDTAMEMRNFTVETGLSSQKMKSWSNAAESVGVAGNTVADTLKHIQMVQAKFKMNQPDEGFIQGIYLLNEYGKAGIDIYDDAFLMQEKIVKGLDKMDSSQKRNVLSLMGINEQMLRFYNDQTAFSERNKRIVPDKESVNNIMEYWKELKKLGQDLKILFTGIGDALSIWLTPLTKVLDFFIKILFYVQKIQTIAVKSSAFLGSLGTIGSIKELGEMALKNPLLKMNSKWEESVKNIFEKLNNFKLFEFLLKNVPLQLRPEVKDKFDETVSKENTKNVNATFNINGDDPAVLKHLTIDALNDVIGNSWNKLNPESY